MQLRMAEYMPAPIDLEHLMKAMKRGKAPGLDGFPSELYRFALQQLARLICLILAKITTLGREPLVLSWVR